MERDCTKSFWQYEFIVPDKLLESVKNMTLQQLSMTRTLQSDENPNGIEGN
jgi:hypothetical protein